jgi:hypothetical protein
MQTRIYPTLESKVEKTSLGPSAWSKFIAWCDSQEEYRFGWLAGIVAGHGCIITPLVLLVILMSGNSFILWPLAILAMAAPLVSNLAAMPTRITIPVFFTSLLVDIGIIIAGVSAMLR